ncbi:hypothetical protein C8Q77DRAFT_1461 [Trametes polyzona]|nr:hypothetical protein C8Q77DRAFT_1461 [Trametes polyzona]
MRSSVITTLTFLVVAHLVNTASIGSGENIKCDNPIVVFETLIGEDKNVKLTESHCDNAPFVTAQGDVVSSLTRRQEASTLVCDAQCNTFCFGPGGGGPNEGDCAVIADALLFDSENGDDNFNTTQMGTLTSNITLQFRSCTTFFLNQATTNLTYCNRDWSALVNFLAGHCNAAHGAHGGLCVAADGRWFVQVEHTHNSSAVA